LGAKPLPQPMRPLWGAWCWS